MRPEANCLGPVPSERCPQRLCPAQGTAALVGPAFAVLYLFILVSYSVLCRQSSALSSVTRPCRVLEWWAQSWARLPGLLGSLLLGQRPTSSRLWPRSGDLWSSLLLGKGEGSEAPSVSRELQAEESLARQAVQLLMEPPAEASKEKVPDHTELDTLGVLGMRLAAGTLS